MTDATPKPKRKRWRWMVAGVLLFLAVVTTDLHSDSVSERSRNIKVGDSREKVVSILGAPDIVSGQRVYYRRWPFVVYWFAATVFRVTGKPLITVYSHEVEIRYDEQGIVSHIHRSDR